jgi:ABC-type microcin C transport system duplicated ATPase subunit YejF
LTQVLDFPQEPRAELNLTYVFISHNLAVMRHICDRAMVMKAGIVVEEGKTQRLFDAPEQIYTRKLLERARATSITACLAG